MQPEDVNRQSIAGRTLPMNAASVGNMELVQYLLSEQADPLLQDTTGKTAYDYAVERGYTDVAELLK